MYSNARTVKKVTTFWFTLFCLKLLFVIFILPFVLTFPFFQAAMIGNVEPPLQAQAQQQNILQFANQVS